jgi:hypothetical protein
LYPTLEVTRYVGYLKKLSLSRKQIRRYAVSYEFKTKRMEKAVVNDAVNKETVEDIKLYPIVENLQRGITKETCMKFGVRAALSEKDGDTKKYLFDGISNNKFKQRNNTKEESEESSENIFNVEEFYEIDSIRCEYNDRENEECPVRNKIEILEPERKNEAKEK